MAEIKWLGHACFRLRGRDVVVVTDPVGPATGYDLKPVSADIVTVSHQHPGHNALDLVQPGYRAITGPGEYEIKEVFITGVQTYHDSEGGARLGKNTVYLFEMEDVVICHLGDLGHGLSEEQVERMNAVDILLVPVGGGPSLDAAQAVEVIGQLEPSVVIPMQYQTAKGDHDRDPIERFLKEVGVAAAEPQDRFSVKKTDLGDSMKVIVLAP